MALLSMEKRGSGIGEGFEARIVGRCDRHPARLQSDIGRDRQLLRTFRLEGFRLLAFGPAEIDALLDRQGLAADRIEGWMARGDTLHGLCRIAMAGGAGFLGGTDGLVPEFLALLHEEHCWIGGIVSLKRARFCRHEGTAG